MNNELLTKAKPTWFPTYGLLTSQRILERLDIRLTTRELDTALSNPHSVYYQLLRIPLKNVFNGIILQQVHDYQAYAQGLFVDYLLSGEANKEETAPGANTRDDLEQQRLHLVELNEAYAKLEAENQELIAKSQASLIALSRELLASLAKVVASVMLILRKTDPNISIERVSKALRAIMIHYETVNDEVLAPSSPYWNIVIKLLGMPLDAPLRAALAQSIRALSDPRNEVEQILSTYLSETEAMEVNLKNYRTEFYNVILRVTELIKLLPDYHVDHEKEAVHRESLYFDAGIGGS